MNTIENDSNDQGVVYQKNTINYIVCAGQSFFSCVLSSRFRGQVGDEVVVGDRVRWVALPDGSGSIVQVLPRKNEFARRSAASRSGAHTFKQVIAANVDQVVPVFAAANPPPHWNMLDRYLVSAELLSLPALICITKLDLAAESGGPAQRDNLSAVVQEYRQIGYPVIVTSVVNGTGLDELRQMLHGRISALLGKSGVGKTSLLNALQPGLGQRVNEVSSFTGKGKHTTSQVEMFPCDFGGALIDTPGVREFGLWDVENDDLALFFPEMRPLVGRCKFGLDCQHADEPGCAVRKAVVAGLVSPRRYQSYLRLKEEGSFK